MTAVEGSAGWKKTVLVCAVILSGALAITWVVFSTEPTAKREGASRKTAMLVEVTPVVVGTYRPVIVVTGTVMPKREVLLRPQVAGRVVERAEAFTPGGVAEEGEVLLRLGAADYDNELRQRQSALDQALTELELEMGQQAIAREEYERLLAGDASSETTELVLREPQLAAAKSRIDAAEAGVNQARLNLGRTTVRAPFTAQVLSREADVGSQVSANSTLGRLVGVEAYWVEASVPLSKRPWIAFPDAAGDGGSEVTLENRTGWPKGAKRAGTVHKLLGALDERTRMARVLIEVDDPLLRREDAGEGPKLIIGEFVEVRITGKPVSDVVRLKRDYVRTGDTAWVMQHRKLRIVKLDVVVRDATYVYASAGLEAGDEVVTSNLATVTEGAALRTEDAESTR